MQKYDCTSAVICLANFSVSFSQCFSGWIHCKPKPSRAYRDFPVSHFSQEKPVFITGNPVLFAEILYSLLQTPVRDCSVVLDYNSYVLFRDTRRDVCIQLFIKQGWTFGPGRISRQHMFCCQMDSIFCHDSWVMIFSRCFSNFTFQFMI